MIVVTRAGDTDPASANITLPTSADEWEQT
jgi:hypothetical protein